MAVQSIQPATKPAALPAISVPTKKARHPLTAAFIRTWRNPLGKFGLAILGLLVFAALAAPWITPYSPIVQHPGFELRGPGTPFILGTDELGRDLLSRVIYGTRPSLVVSLIVVGLGGGLGIISGLVAGFLGGWIDII